jgi:hypothetical protein
MRKVYAKNNNASAHLALSVREFLANKQITVLEYSPNPLDLAPKDFSSVTEDN